MKNSFNVLFIYPNTPLLNPAPVSIGIMVSLLRAAGISVKVFDTTYYVADDGVSDKAKEENLQVRPFSFDESQLPLLTSSPGEDLRALIEEYRPDLVAMSVLEGTWATGAELLDAIAELEQTVLVGGIFATFAPDIVLSHPAVDILCVGEGEGPLVELCDRMRDGLECNDIKNLWFKRTNGQVIKNPLRTVVDFNKIPIPDYSVFDKARLLRPMAGRVYRTVPIETNRGCPYACTFCNSPTTAKLYRDNSAGIFFRKKSMDRIQEELRYLIKRWDAEYVYFLSDTFLAMSNDEFDRFVEIYSAFRLPFWIQSRVETITEYRAAKLKEIGCHRMSIGLEHGNSEFRHKILKKKFSNDQMIKAAKILEQVGIPLSVNNIIGFPDETRELIFDTIELNRQIPFDTSNAYVFAPFHGTPLYDYCFEKGYISGEQAVGCLTIDTSLDMPQLSKKEVAGLRKTFALYAKMPKEYWDKIKVAERNDEIGREAFSELKQIYTEKYF